MDRKKLIREMGEKLRRIRDSLNLRNFEMADRLGIYRTSYYRNELGVTAPQLTALYQLGKLYDISMDWLILDRGPLHYKEKEFPITAESAKIEPVPPIAGDRDVKELLDYMERVPLFRHEVLVMFYKFKDQYKVKDSSTTNDKSG
ncbi:MAG TPA: helix-turn-helix domain-containing protein [Candidatus Kapabacteria bacterium]|nr:helix-turn-helix domain-containing protein [Candidatus Kapabacteria bacterium]